MIIEPKHLPIYSPLLRRDKKSFGRNLVFLRFLALLSRGQKWGALQTRARDQTIAEEVGKYVKCNKNASKKGDSHFGGCLFSLIKER